MAMDAAATRTDPEEVAEQWICAFAAALEAGDAAAAAGLFLPDGHWRDIVAFTWNIETFNGRAAIGEALAGKLGEIKPHNFHLPAGRAAPRLVTRAGTETIEALIAFKTAHGNASAVLRLVPDQQSGDWRAWIFATSLDDLSQHGIVEGSQSLADAFSRDFGGENWLDKRVRAQRYADREPTVLVVGAGQAGLGIAARLSALGIDTLVIDRHVRIGDNWRKRYHSLTLHNEAHVNHLPFIPFPKTFPVFIPKDKLANWFEFYADAMDLNVWTGTEMVAGSYDQAEARYDIDLRFADGTARTVHPRHVVMATGVSAIPVMPALPGLGTFVGTLMHSGSYTDGKAWKGKRALVIGTGNSAHDVAQDLQASGADVTMMQRSSSYIVSLSEAQKVYAIYNEGPSFEDCDLITTAGPYAFLYRTYQLSTAEMKRVDKPLLDRLSARGFRLDDGGEGGTGFQMKYMQRGGGYYFNVGCSDLIADGKIKLIHHEDFSAFEPEGARMKDGNLVAADLAVAATGYKNQQETVRQYMGSGIADRIGPVWGFNEGGELANMWQRTPQPGLWFTAGSLAQSRIYSKYLALQIAAIEAGLLAKARPAG